MRPSGSPEALKRRRLRALALLEDVFQPIEAAKKLKVDRRSVRRWKAALKNQGPKAIKAKPSPGRPPKIDKQAKKELEERLLQGAAGFQTDLWTCPRVAQLIHACFGGCYHVDHTGRLLHSLGYRSLRNHRERQWRGTRSKSNNGLKSTGPALKKKARA